MKFVSFTRNGVCGFGVVLGDGIVDLTNRLAPGANSLKKAISQGILDNASCYVGDGAPELAWSDFQFLPVIPDPGKIFCIGLNYETHREETKRPVVENPTVFTRYADSQVGNRQPMIKPKSTNRFDFEGEMAVVIGRGGRYIPEENAMDHVAGFSCYNEGSVRNWQRHTSQFTPGKTFPGTGAFGPFLVTPGEVGDYEDLPIQTRLNGNIMQDATLADLIFPLPKLIGYISQFTPLSPGDVIVTGTPGGVGDRRNPPVYLEPGDTVEVDIGVLGTLTNPVVAEI